MARFLGSTIRAYTGRLDAVQVVTWHDYEEGTEIQSGIDNCLSITASVSGTLLNWHVADESTLDHYTAFISLDGQNLMSLGDYAVGTHTLDLSAFNFPPGTYQVLVKAVGKPSIVNHMSASEIYHDTQLGMPTQLPTSPSVGQHAGPNTNLHANASSPNGVVKQSPVLADGSRAKMIAGAASSPRRIATPVERSTITSKAEDSAQRWSGADVGILRTY